MKCISVHRVAHLLTHTLPPTPLPPSPSHTCTLHSWRCTREIFSVFIARWRGSRHEKVCPWHHRAEQTGTHRVWGNSAWRYLSHLSAYTPSPPHISHTITFSHFTHHHLLTFHTPSPHISHITSFHTPSPPHISHTITSSHFTHHHLLTFHTSPHFTHHHLTFHTPSPPHISHTVH